MWRAPARDGSCLCSLLVPSSLFAGALVVVRRLCDWPDGPSRIFVSSFTDGPIDDRFRSPDRVDVDLAGRNLRILCLRPLRGVVDNGPDCRLPVLLYTQSAMGSSSLVGPSLPHTLHWPAPSSQHRRPCLPARHPILHWTCGIAQKAPLLATHMFDPLHHHSCQAILHVRRSVAAE